MLPPLTAAGMLPPGVHRATWKEFAERFGVGPRRDSLLRGLEMAARNLRHAGVEFMWLGGSFVTDKEEPGDWDGAWDPMDANLTMIDPLLLDLDDLANGRFRQKAKYGGELFVDIEAGSRLPFQLFFQGDLNGDSRGIVLLDLRTLS